MTSEVNDQSVNGHIDSIDVSDHWLRVFDAVGASGSFTAAADQLGIGQPSVSHAIKRLESALSVQLFERRERGARLTSTGRRLWERLRPAWETIDAAIEEVRPRRTDHLVALSVSTSFATWWLLPRLASFKSVHPDVELRCITSDDDDRVGHEDADIWIPHGADRWPHLDSVVLTDERIQPVASPAIAERLSMPDDPASLVDATLIHLEERYGSRFDWAAWFAAQDLEAPPLRGPRSNDYAVVVQAALDGQGVALGWEHIVGPLVADGRLVRVGGRPIETDSPFVLLRRPGARRRDVDTLAQWLVATVG